MKFSIRNQKDVAAGLLYVAFGAAFSLGALNYKLGEPARMGPGWFPFAIGVLLVIVGAVTSARARPRESFESRTRLRLVVVGTLLVNPFGGSPRPAAADIRLRLGRR